MKNNVKKVCFYLDDETINILEAVEAATGFYSKSSFAREAIKKLGNRFLEMLHQDYLDCHTLENDD